MLRGSLAGTSGRLVIKSRRSVLADAIAGEAVARSSFDLNWRIGEAFAERASRSSIASASRCRSDSVSIARLLSTTTSRVGLFGPHRNRAFEIQR